jgi:tetratricopeptide (TPR) repeat protein
MISPSPSSRFKLSHSGFKRNNLYNNGIMKRGWLGLFGLHTKSIPIGLICCAFIFLSHGLNAQTHAGLAHAQRAQALMQAQQNSEAIQEWKAALKAEPGNPVYRNLYGLALQSVGRAPEARKQFQQAIKLNPGFADAHSNLAYNFWTDGDESAASAEFNRALKFQPSDPNLHLPLGLLALSDGKKSEACLHFDQAKPWPQDPQTLWSIFSGYQNCDQPEKSLQAARMLPSDAETQLTIGKTLLAFHEPQSAIFFLEHSGDSSTRSPAVIWMLADAYLSSGNPQIALQQLETLSEADRVSKTSLELRASCLMKLGKRSEAQEQFMSLIEKFPDDPEAYINATQIPLEDQNWQQSLEIVNSGLQRIPTNWLLLFRRAMTFKLSSQLGKAQTDLLEAMRHEGDVPLLSAALGEVYAAQGNLVDAAQIFRKTFVETNIPAFQFAYALALEKEGNDAQALSELKKSAELLPNDARVHFEYGKMLRKNAQIKEARQELERARALDPDLAGNLYVLSRLYQTLGETDRAAKVLKEFNAATQKSGLNPQ